MNLCSDGHEKICFEGRICPLCDMRDELRAEIINRDKEIQAMERLIKTLKETKS